MNGADLINRPRGRRMFSRYEGGEVSIKGDADDDIKDYAETTMNELLGWYGYEKVDSRDTQGLNLQHFASTQAEAEGSPILSVREGSEDESVDPLRTDGASTPVLPRPRSNSPGGSSPVLDEVTRQHQQMVTALSSVIKHPGAPDSPNLPPGCIVCAWCQKVGMKLFTLKTTNGSKAFCSELCFTQCRRASFKKNKVCDWCKHVRHTVNYVDFQDGEQQLQFCSDKCLNQYKMNIFCKETQAHLQMHTHLKEAACKVPGSSGGSINLITPDLWLRDCVKTPPINGGVMTPNDHVDLLTDGNISDDNIGATQSPPLPPSSRTSEPRMPSPASIVKDKIEDRPEYRRPSKIREKRTKRSEISSSRIPSKRNGHDGKTHHGHRMKEKRYNRTKYRDLHNSSQSNILSSLNSIPNGLSSRLTSPPMVQPSAVPPSLHQQLPPRLPPPLVDRLRPPFLPPNLVPSPFHILAQQQMEAFLRSQNRMGIRPDCPPFPLPPWGLPPLPHGPQLPHPGSAVSNHHLSGLPPMPRNSRSDFLPIQKPSKSTNLKHSKHSHHNHNHHPPPHPPTNTEKSTKSSGTSSLLPPVTVMVPFPVVLPMPFPIPIPIPISEKLLEKFKNRSVSEHNTESNAYSNKDTVLKTSNSNEKHAALDSELNNQEMTIPESINIRLASSDIDDIPPSFPINRLSQFQSPKDFCVSPLAHNDSLDSAEIQSYDSISKLDADQGDSLRSYSSLSDSASVDEDVGSTSCKIAAEEEEGNKTNFPILPQIPYSIQDNSNLMFSSPLTAIKASKGRVMTNPFDGLDRRRTPSPLRSGEKRFPVISSSLRDCKRHCLREGLNLVMCKESV